MIRKLSLLRLAVFFFCVCQCHEVFTKGGYWFCQMVCHNYFLHYHWSSLSFTIFIIIIIIIILEVIVTTINDCFRLHFLLYPHHCQYPIKLHLISITIHNSMFFNQPNNYLQFSSSHPNIFRFVALNVSSPPVPVPVPRCPVGCSSLWWAAWSPASARRSSAPPGCGASGASASGRCRRPWTRTLMSLKTAGWSLGRESWFGCFVDCFV